jgi:hypothetical protein
MPRFVIERDWGLISTAAEDLQGLAGSYASITMDEFPDLQWELSHVCSDKDGAIKSYCVFTGPGHERLREHAERVGGHLVRHIYEVIGDITPGDVRL